MAPASALLALLSCTAVDSVTGPATSLRSAWRNARYWAMASSNCLTAAASAGGLLPGCGADSNSGGNPTITSTAADTASTFPVIHLTFYLHNSEIGRAHV